MNLRQRKLYWNYIKEKLDGTESINKVGEYLFTQKIINYSSKIYRFDKSPPNKTILDEINKKYNLAINVESIIKSANSEITIGVPYSILSAPLINMLIKEDTDDLDLFFYQKEDGLPRKFNIREGNKVSNLQSEIKSLQNDTDFRIYSDKELQNLLQRDNEIIGAILSSQISNMFGVEPFFSNSFSIEGTCKPLILTSKKHNDFILQKYGIQEDGSSDLDSAEEIESRGAYDFLMLYDSLKTHGNKSIKVYYNSEDSIIDHFYSYYFKNTIKKNFQSLFQGVKVNTNSLDTFLRCILKVELSELEMETLDKALSLIKSQGERNNLMKEALVKKVNQKNEIILVLCSHPLLNWFDNLFKDLNNVTAGVIIQELSDLFSATADPMIETFFYFHEHKVEKYWKEINNLIGSLARSITELKSIQDRCSLPNYQNSTIKEIADFLNMDYESFKSVFAKINYKLMFTYNYIKYQRRMLLDKNN